MKNTLILISMVFVFCDPASASSGDVVNADIFKLAGGKWGWQDGPTTCSDGGMEIQFSPDRQRMTITYQHPIRQYDGSEISSASYDVLRIDESGIELRMDGETRVFDGALVTWRIQLDGDDRFFWEAIELKKKLGPSEIRSWSWGPAERCN